MSSNELIHPEGLAASAFSRQSHLFDAIYSPNPIIQYKRQRVREHLASYLSPASHILELNAGTGEDAVYFAGQGHTVHATDVSEGMLEKLSEKVNEQELKESITSELCSFTNLASLSRKGPYDMIFSNFAGLNCTPHLKQVLQSFDELLKPGGLVTLVVMPPFCLWELSLSLRGNFKAAFRRFGSSKGTNAHVEGINFKCWYYRPSYIVRTLEKNYQLLKLEGLCTIVPPSYYEHFATKRPVLFSFLKKWEARLKSAWPWMQIGDYYIITLRKPG